MIFSLALLRILRRVCEQLVNSHAVTVLRYTGCNTGMLTAATAWLMLSFSSNIVCGFDSYTVLFKRPQRKFLPLPPGGGGGEKPRYFRVVVVLHYRCVHENKHRSSTVPFPKINKTSKNKLSLHSSVLKT